MVDCAYPDTTLRTCVYSKNPPDSPSDNAHTIIPPCRPLTRILRRRRVYRPAGRTRVDDAVDDTLRKLGMALNGEYLDVLWGCRGFRGVVTANEALVVANRSRSEQFAARGQFGDVVSVHLFDILPDFESAYAHRLRVV